MATDVPAELRRQVTTPARAVASNRDVALLIIDYDQALSQANGQIGAIDTILTKATRAASEQKKE